MWATLPCYSWHLKWQFYFGFFLSSPLIILWAFVPQNPALLCPLYWCPHFGFHFLLSRQAVGLVQFSSLKEICVYVLCGDRHPKSVSREPEKGREPSVAKSKLEAQKISAKVNCFLRSLWFLNAFLSLRGSMCFSGIWLCAFWLMPFFIIIF